MVMRKVEVVVVERRDPVTDEINGALAGVHDPKTGAQIGFAEGRTGYEAACEALATVNLPVEEED